MKFEEKLQRLRKNKNITQEQLAKELFVSRTAISKWESGRGYPSIDSLKEIAKYFDISLDELLSNDELFDIAKVEVQNKNSNTLRLSVGLTNLLLIVFLFLPIFGYRKNDEIIECSLIELEAYLYILIPYYLLMILSICDGIALLFTINITNKRIINALLILSLLLLVLQIIVFMLTLEPYAGIYTILILMIQVILCYKIKMTR